MLRRDVVPRSFNARLLVDARLGLNLTQEQAAALVGVDVRTYRRYESGEVNQGGAFGVRHPSRRRILARIAVELGVAEEELVVASEPPDAHRAVETRAEMPIHYEHALPRARVFVGRSALVEQLRAWIDDPAPSARVLALVALGGAGKTTLVEHVITRRGDGPRAAGIFVYSFYDDDRAEAFFERALARVLCAYRGRCRRGRPRCRARACARRRRSASFGDRWARGDPRQRCGRDDLWADRGRRATAFLDPHGVRPWRCARARDVALRADRCCGMGE